MLGRLERAEVEGLGDSGHAVDKGNEHQREVLAVSVPSP